jgi:hypothetical protein
LDALIDELTVDAYNDEEQLGGFLVGADAAVRGGVRATLVGFEVEVLAVDCGPDARTGGCSRACVMTRPRTRSRWRTCSSRRAASSGW